jgi:hypothetical protein
MSRELRQGLESPEDNIWIAGKIIWVWKLLHKAGAIHSVFMTVMVGWADIKQAQKKLKCTYRFDCKTFPPRSVVRKKLLKLFCTTEIFKQTDTINLPLWVITSTDPPRSLSIYKKFDKYSLRKESKMHNWRLICELCCWDYEYVTVE